MKKFRVGLIIVLTVTLLAVLTSCIHGESAYDIAVRNGYTGSETEWLASLNGANGQNGTNGINGTNGVNGQDGKDGTNGENGVGVESVKLDENGYLIVTLTNGVTVNAGYIGTVAPDSSTEAPKLNVTTLNIPTGSAYILTSDRPDTTFTSSNNDIVQISSEGLLLAVCEGSATVTATARDGKTATCTVNSLALSYKKTSDGGVKITGYNGELTELVIPDDIMGMAVTEIGESAFVGKKITSVTLPSTLLTVGDNAFNGCAELTAIAIPAQVISLGESAFANCIALTEVSVSNGCSYAESTFINTPWNEANKIPGPPLNVFIDVNEAVWVYPTDDNDAYLPGHFSNYYNEPDKSKYIGSLADKTELIRTGVLYENETLVGWSRLTYQGQTIYMRNSQITTVVPSPETPLDPPTPPESDDIYAYDPSTIPEGMIGRLPQDLSSSEKGIDNISDKSDVYDPELDRIMNIEVSSSVALDEPLVLILHTHATEAYTAPGVAWYAPNNADIRSNDITQNVVSVGALLAEKLNALGISTLHCEIMHDADTYTGAYDNSAETIKRYLEQYPTIKYVIDLHRDFVEKDSTGEIIRPVTEVDGKAAAQLMCVVGTGTEVIQNDHWETNLALAQKLRAKLSESYPKLCRPTYLRDSSYNQQLAPYSLLIEMGSSANTLDEVKYTAELLAPELAAVIRGE